MKITKKQLRKIIKEEISKAFGSEGAEVLKKLRPEEVLSAARDSEEYKHTLNTGKLVVRKRGREYGQLGYISHDTVLHIVINGMCKTMGKGDNCQPIYHHGDREYGFRINFELFGPVDKRTDFGKMVDDLYDQLSNELKPNALGIPQRLEDL
jgi:hypothetical protein